MEHSPPWKANSFSASQDISHILWNPKFDYHVHKRLLLVPILRHINQVHTLPSDYLKIHINIILLCTPRSKKKKKKEKIMLKSSTLSQAGFVQK